MYTCIYLHLYICKHTYMPACARTFVCMQRVGHVYMHPLNSFVLKQSCHCREIRTKCHIKFPKLKWQCRALSLHVRSQKTDADTLCHHCYAKTGCWSFHSVAFRALNSESQQSLQSRGHNNCRQQIRAARVFGCVGATASGEKRQHDPLLLCAWAPIDVQTAWAKSVSMGPTWGEERGYQESQGLKT